VMFESTLQTPAHDKAVCRQALSSSDVIALYSFASSAYSPVDIGCRNFGFRGFHQAPRLKISLTMHDNVGKTTCPLGLKCKRC
jgi:hypothetical protein